MLGDLQLDLADELAAVERDLAPQIRVPASKGPALPDSYWIEKKAPLQVTPGTRTVNIDKPGSSGGTYHSTTHYDEYGRQIGQTHRTSHGRPTDHPDPHHHRRDPATGEKLKDPNTGSRVWPGWFGWNG